MRRVTRCANMLFLVLLCSECSSGSIALPPSLVGEWRNSRFEESYTFRADGTYLLSPVFHEESEGTYETEQRALILEPTRIDMIRERRTIPFEIDGTRLAMEVMHALGRHDGPVGTWRRTISIVGMTSAGTWGPPYEEHSELELKADGSLAGRIHPGKTQGTGTWQEEPDGSYRITLNGGDGERFQGSYQLVGDALANHIYDFVE